MNEYKDLWEEFYKDGKYSMGFPGEPEIKFFNRLKKERSLDGLKALDFGCGIGRNLGFMEGLGLETYGLEISEEAVNLCKERGFNVSLYDGKHIPFKDEFFDIIISFGVLDHMLFFDAFYLMHELYRILKNEGKMLLVLHSVFDSNYTKNLKIEENIKNIKIEENTFIITREISDFEIGIPQHYFSQQDIDLLTNKFTIERYTLHENKNFIGNLYNKDSFWELYLKKL